MLELPGGVQVVDRGEWLKVLLKNLPRERLYGNKKLAGIENRSNHSYVLHFEDGSTHEADAVIGCDGLYSKVRQKVLGPERQHLWNPVFAGYWDARGRTTAARAAEMFGAELFDPRAAKELAFAADGAFLLFQPTDNKETYHVIISCPADSDFDKTSWKTQLTREYLEKFGEKWDEKFRLGVIESLMAEDSGPGVVFSQWESPETPTYCRDRLCVLGDAAHATTPA